MELIPIVYISYGIAVFYFGFKTGRNTRYQDDNLPPPPDPLTGGVPNPKKTFIQDVLSMLKRKQDGEKEARLRTGVVSELEEPDFTKRQGGING